MSVNKYDKYIGNLVSIEYAIKLRIEIYNLLKSSKDFSKEFIKGTGYLSKLRQEFFTSLALLESISKDRENTYLKILTDKEESSKDVHWDSELIYKNETLYVQCKDWFLNDYEERKHALKEKGSTFLYLKNNPRYEELKVKKKLTKAEKNEKSILSKKRESSEDFFEKKINNSLHKFINDIKIYNQKKYKDLILLININDAPISVNSRIIKRHQYVRDQIGLTYFKSLYIHYNNTIFKIF